MESTPPVFEGILGWIRGELRNVEAIEENQKDGIDDIEAEDPKDQGHDYILWP